MGIVLQNTQRILCIDIAGTSGVRSGRDYQLDLVFQQAVAVGSFDFGDDIGVILTTLNHNLAGLAIIGDRGEYSGFRLFRSVAGDIVDTFRLVQSCLQIVSIGIILDNELDLLEQAFLVGNSTVLIAEDLGQVDAKAENMGIVNQRVIVLRAGTLPGQHDLIVVAVITVNEAVIRVDRSCIGDAHGVVGVACIYMTVDVFAGTIDFGQTHVSDTNRHVTTVLAIGNSGCFCVIDGGI